METSGHMLIYPNIGKGIAFCEMQVVHKEMYIKCLNQNTSFR